MKQINIFLIVLVFLFVLFPFFLSNKVDEKLTYEIEAPIGLVYDEFLDLRKFSKWEQFTGQDSTVIKTFSEEEIEKEFSEWKSTKSDVGNGKIKIDNFEMNQSIDYIFKYEGWEDEDTLSIDFEQTSSGNTLLNVHYTSQEVPFYYRYFLFFKSPLKKVEKSIENFNELVKVRLDKERKEGKLNYGEFRLIKLNKQVLMAIKKSSSLDDNDAMEKVDEAFEVIYKSLINEEDSYDFDLGFPTVYTTEIDSEKKKKTLFAGINFVEGLTLQKGMQRVIVPEGEYLLTMHQGSRNKKKHTLQLMRNYAKSKKIELGDRELEVFLNDPKETDSLQLKTRIYIPIITN
ncbi:GyrI-like domain-containing protein [Faecalibacter macacae]|uniref:GyrI-like small molecule binding domain-containing protein n=1 Tax=Faecalibacter macacae TaxID=1859289 RepID=A0A3L9M2E5_9FLAO|nr:GyrI-like domain-containing protein [Faecalibacter macacae]RLZ07327.1 hypothetical protein EAH69_11485 [Faecalibacter macacae]